MKNIRKIILFIFTFIIYSTTFSNNDTIAFKKFNFSIDAGLFYVFPIKTSTIYDTTLYNIYQNKNYYVGYGISSSLIYNLNKDFSIIGGIEVNTYKDRIMEKCYFEYVNIPPHFIEYKFQNFLFGVPLMIKYERPYIKNNVSFNIKLGIKLIEYKYFANSTATYFYPDSTVSLPINYQKFSLEETIRFRRNFYIHHPILLSIGCSKKITKKSKLYLNLFYNFKISKPQYDGLFQEGFHYRDYAGFKLGLIF